MKIVHISVIGPYTDGLSYQENMLAKYHHLDGHEVILLANQYSFMNDGYPHKVDKGSFISQDGYKYIRLETKHNLKYKFKRYKNIIKLLKLIKPDLIFSHGFQYIDILKIARFATSISSKLIVDNHADFTNSARNFLSKIILHKNLWRIIARKISKHVHVFYGVTPSRVEFLKHVYKVNRSKVKLLIMGVDDEIMRAIKDKTTQLRYHYNIDNADFVITTGGKIDQSKIKIISLIQEISKMNDNSIKLLIFGSIESDIMTKVEKYFNDNIKYLGWKTSSQVYELMSISDLMFFPGRHSVYWEQSVGLGVPCVFSKKEGFEHLDLNGNCIFLSDQNYGKLILNIKKNQIQLMRKSALSDQRENFYYSNIAKKCLFD